TLEIKPVETTQTADEEAIPTGKPFTPAGSGTVMDNVTDGDGKEFFSITTDDGNVFYLIIDRQRNSDNVYLLNAVSEDDLIALAQKNGKTIGNTKTEQITTITQTNPATTAASDTKEKTGGMNSGTVIFIIIAVLGVGGAGYYFKIYKNKKKTSDSDEDYDDNPDETAESDDDLGFENGEDGDSDE
ncbi:MAG: DUF4366 domain-containing protein, partial [Oscillospiraceae bacterium]|nr:DUF4366 domain-containing protein [Oscillospiraceae bacterium]